jgi:hypothetical protein
MALAFSAFQAVSVAFAEAETCPSIDSCQSIYSQALTGDVVPARGLCNPQFSCSFETEV